MLYQNTTTDGEKKIKFLWMACSLHCDLPLTWTTAVIILLYTNPGIQTSITVKRTFTSTIVR